MLKATSSIVNVSQITGVLPVVNGGTGVTTSTGTGSTVLSAAPTLSGNVTLSTGNLIVASGQGIDFSATPGTGTSELLADYEEGTWTPSVDGTTSGTAGGYFFRNAVYTKVGRQVTCSTYVAISGIGTMVGNFKVSGLPFTAGGASPIGYAVVIGYTNIGSIGIGYTANADVGTGTTAIIIFRTSNGVSAACPVNAVFDVELSVTYMV